MAFVKTTWTDGAAPAVSAAQLNRIEQGIADAHAFASYVEDNSDSAAGEDAFINGNLTYSAVYKGNGTTPAARPAQEVVIVAGAAAAETWEVEGYLYAVKANSANWTRFVAIYQFLDAANALVANSQAMGDVQSHNALQDGGYVGMPMRRYLVTVPAGATRKVHIMIAGTAGFGGLYWSAQNSLIARRRA